LGSVLTGYDPRGLGWGGFGFLAGYTREEVEGVPKLSADELVKYFDQTVEALCDYILKLPSEDLYRPAAGWPDSSDTAYEWIRHFLMDSLGHLGEIRAIHAMWERRIRVVLPFARTLEERHDLRRTGEAPDFDSKVA
jgi:hypothetical protein